MGDVTPHFSRREFDLPESKAAEYGCAAAEYPAEWIGSRLRPLCQVLEVIRDACGGRPVTIVCGYRTAEYDQARIAAGREGISPHSQHVQGLAADISVRGVEPEQLRNLVVRLHTTGRIRVGGVGLYRWGMHVDLRQLLQPGARLALW